MSASGAAPARTLCPRWWEPRSTGPLPPNPRIPKRNPNHHMRIPSLARVGFAGLALSALVALVGCSGESGGFAGGTAGLAGERDPGRGDGHERGAQLRRRRRQPARRRLQRHAHRAEPRPHRASLRGPAAGRRVGHVRRTSSPRTSRRAPSTSRRSRTSTGEVLLRGDRDHHARRAPRSAATTSRSSSSTRTCPRPRLSPRRRWCSSS